MREATLATIDEIELMVINGEKGKKKKRIEDVLGQDEHASKKENKKPTTHIYSVNEGCYQWLPSPVTPFSVLSSARALILLRSLRSCKIM